MHSEFSSNSELELTMSHPVWGFPMTTHTVGDSLEGLTGLSLSLYLRPWFITQQDRQGGKIQAGSGDTSSNSLPPGSITQTSLSSSYKNAALYV